ncbi:unnamed protein product [Microthlaspi erraticum]|uniref:Uncharacterized protein n=1 Tax=Microthlaspi erraticum TaxID=1685480 RepID=A0A6D2KR99_9BRAS|nr:unnamed protein product [Microthlaspi erraticum]
MARVELQHPKQTNLNLQCRRWRSFAVAVRMIALPSLCRHRVTLPDRISLLSLIRWLLCHPLLTHPTRLLNDAEEGKLELVDSSWRSVRRSSSRYGRRTQEPMRSFVVAPQNRHKFNHHFKRSNSLPSSSSVPDLPLPFNIGETYDVAEDYPR